jgi:hypothetical protein
MTKLPVTKSYRPEKMISFHPELQEISPALDFFVSLQRINLEIELDRFPTLEWQGN